MELIVIAGIAVIAIMIAAGGRSRGDRWRDRSDAPWWTMGLFALGPRDEEQAREMRDDARMAGDQPMAASGSPDERDGGGAYGGGDAGDDGGDGDGGGDGGDGGD